MYVFHSCTSLMMYYPVIDSGKTECQYPLLCVMNCADSMSLLPLWLKFLIFSDDKLVRIIVAQPIEKFDDVIQQIN